MRLEARPGGRLWADRPGLLPASLRDSLAAHRPEVLALLAGRQHAHGPARDAPPPDAEPRSPPRAWRLYAVPTLPGVPLDWREGVALLAAWPAPQTIPPPRWAILAATSARLLRDHGAALHAARWDTIALFGLHAEAPATHPPGWGLAWLLGESGDVLDVVPDVIGMRQGPGGARLTYRRPGASAWAGTVPAWLRSRTQCFA